MSYRDRQPTVVTLPAVTGYIETNEDRAELVHPLYKAFAEHCYGDWQGEHDADPHTILGDLIGDLLHLADLFEADPAEVIRRAQYHYQCEVDEAEWDRANPPSEVDA